MPSKIPTLDKLTKIIKRVKYIDPETGWEGEDPKTKDTTVPKRALSPSKASQAIMDFIQLKISAADKDNGKQLNYRPPLWWATRSGIWKPDGIATIKEPDGCPVW